MSSYFEPTAVEFTAAQVTNVNTAANDARSGTTSRPIANPDEVNTGAVQLTSGANNVYGVWFQVVAPNVLAGHMLTSLSWSSNTANAPHVIDIGTGTAGNEVVVGSWPYASGLANVGVTIPIVPAIQVPANARIAARVVNGGGVGGILVLVLCGWMPRPIA